MAILHKNITASGDIHNPKWHPDANNGDYAWKNEKGELESIDELLLPAALNFVDGSVAPPTSNTNDIYILSSGGSVNAGWGSVALQDWVKYDGAAWNAITPQKSSLCYDKTADSLMSFNGTAWAAIGGGGGGDSIYTVSGTVPTSITATITDSLTFAGGKVILSSTTNGILLNRVTTSEMNLMTGMATNEIVFNTDLNGLYRYDGSNWVALAAGFGIVGTTDATGSPTFYATVKAAYDAGQGSVKLYSDITESVSRTINIVNGRDIDLNGFTYTYSATDGSNMFDDNIGNCTIRIINGRLLRSNGTTLGEMFNFNLGHTQIDIVNVFAENTVSRCLNLKPVAFNGTGSTFISNSNGNSVTLSTNIKGGTYIANTIGSNSLDATNIIGVTCKAEHSTGRNFLTGNVSNSEFYATTHTGLQLTGVSKASNCYVKATTGNGLVGSGTTQTAINCTVISSTGSAAYRIRLVDCYLESGASSQAVVVEGSLIIGCNIVSTSTGTGYGIYYPSNTYPKVINNTIEIQGTSGQAISLQGATDASVLNNTINVANSAIIGIRMYAKNAYIFGNVAKGTTNLINATTGTNLWTASIDSANNSAEL